MNRFEKGRSGTDLTVGGHRRPAAAGGVDGRWNNGPVSDQAFRAFLDESSPSRGLEYREYMVCAAFISTDACEAVREQLRPLLMRGQVKLHWTDESERRRRDIVARIVDLGPMNVVVSHLDKYQRRVERHRKKCLEVLYHQMVAMQVFDLTLECRSDHQDREDRAHIVALQGQGLDRRLRIGHARGGDEPILWIADAVLGAINSSHHGEDRYIERLRSTIVLDERTPGSLQPVRSERP